MLVSKTMGTNVSVFISTAHHIIIINTSVVTMLFIISVAIMTMLINIIFITIIVIIITVNTTTTIPSPPPPFHHPADVNVCPQVPPQAASTVKKEGASENNVYSEPEAYGQLSTQTTVTQSAAEDSYNRLGAVRGSNPPPQSGGATPHRAYDHVVPARDGGAYDVAQIGQRKKKDVIDFNYHQLEAFSKGK